MSYRYLCLTLISAFLAFSCVDPSNPSGPDNPDNPDNPEQPDDHPKPGVYKFVIAPDMTSKASVAATGKSSWEAGDEILITGGYSPGAVTVKLQGSDISADGKTATVTLDVVPESVFGDDKFYAAWPAGDLDLDDYFSEDRFKFINTDAPLMCAWLSEDNTFKFNHICAAISFSVSGNYDECVFAGNNWELVSYNSWEVQTSSETYNFSLRKGTSDYFKHKTPKSDGSVVLYFPGGLSLKDGFSIYMHKGSAYPKVYKLGGELKLSRGNILALGDISSKLEDYSGPAPELPEMPVMGKYTKFEVKDVPELSGICLTEDHTALWAVGDNGWFGQISLDGKVTQWWKKSADLEGITLHPETGDLYLANEAYQVLRLKPPYEKPSSWEVVISVSEASKYGNSGMEGISYYKDDLLFVGTQTGANVWLYSINGEKRSEYVSLQKFGAGIKEVGGLCWDNLNHWLWVTDSETHKLFVIDEQLTHVLASYPVPYIHNNESVCVDHDNSCVWVGLDDDDVCCLYKIEFSGLDPR